MDGPLDVDEIWNALGKWGRYQRGQICFCLMSGFVVSFQLLSFVFIAYRPPFVCNETTAKDIFPNQDQDENNFTFAFAYNECSIDVYDNGSDSSLITSTGCVSGYKYDVRHDTSIVTEWSLFCDGAEKAELAQTIVVLGHGIGSTVFSALCDMYGRKPVHIICNIIMFWVALGSAWAPNPPVFICLRFILGTMHSGSSVPAAVIPVETLPTESRYLWMIADMLCWTTGCLLVAPVAYLFRNFSWRYMQIAFAFGSIYSLIEYWFFEESLRWLLANGKKEKAKKIIRMAARMNGKDFDSIIKAASSKGKVMERLKAKPSKLSAREHLLKTDVEVNIDSKDDEKVQKDRMPEKYNALTIFKHKRTLLISLIMWYTWMTNSLVYYGLYLGSTSLSGNRYINYLLMTLVEYPALALLWYMIKRYGRRKSCMIFHTIAGVSLAVSTLCRTYQDDVVALETVSLVFNLLGKFGITASFSTIILYTPELYPTNLRSIGVGLASTSSRIGGMLAPFSGSVGNAIIWVPGTIFSVMCLITVYLTSFLPETSGYKLPTTIGELKLWYKMKVGNGQNLEQEAAP